MSQEKVSESKEIVLGMDTEDERKIVCRTRRVSREDVVSDIYFTVPRAVHKV